MTYTTASLEVTAIAYDEIAAKLRAAGYDHAFTTRSMADIIDMNGIGLVRGAGPGAASPEIASARGYAAIGAGQYIMSHSAAGSTPELIITFATDEEKARRTVGDLEDSMQKGIDPSEMIVRLEFVSVAGLNAFERQLKVLREVHFSDDEERRIRDAAWNAAVGAIAAPVAAQGEAVADAFKEMQDEARRAYRALRDGTLGGSLAAMENLDRIARIDWRQCLNPVAAIPSEQERSAQEDAARYRWLAKRGYLMQFAPEHEHDQSIDENIDQAMRLEGLMK